MHDRGVGEGRGVRAALVAAALELATLLLALPLAVQVTQALAGGLRAFVAAITDPDAVAAVRLTLLVAAIVVPANTLFGVAAAWALTRFRFRGRRWLRLRSSRPAPTPTRAASARA